MIKRSKVFIMSIFSLLASAMLFFLCYYGDISTRSALDFDTTSYLIVGYIFKELCIVCLIFFVVFMFLFLLLGITKCTKKTFMVAIIVFVICIFSTILVSYLRADYKEYESIDVLTEKKQSIESFGEEFQKYLLNNAYFEYDDKYVLIKSSKIPGSTYTYVECLPWDDSDLNIEYHLECLKSDNPSLINKLHHEIYLRNLVYGDEETCKEGTYVLFENIVDNDSSKNKYLNIIIEKENIIYSVEIYTTEEIISKLGKSRIIDDIIQNYNNLSDQL